MARIAKNYCDYFPHQNNMRNHKKIKAIRNKYGVTGYAIWNFLLEFLTGSDGNVFEFSETEIELMSGDFGVSVLELSDVLNYCLKLELLFNVDGFIHSPSLDTNLLPVYEKRQVAKQLSAQQLRYNGKFCNVITDASGQSVTEIPHTKLNKSKLNESEEKPIGFLPTEKQKNSFEKFQNWIKDEVPEISKMAKPFTIKQYVTLIGEMPDPKSPTGFKPGIAKSEVIKYLQSIENNKTYIKKYRSPYLCVLAWHNKK